MNSLFSSVEGVARYKRHYQNSQFLFKPNKRDASHLFAYKCCRSRDDGRIDFSRRIKTVPRALYVDTWNLQLHVSLGMYICGGFAECIRDGRICSWQWRTISVTVRYCFRGPNSQSLKSRYTISLPTNVMCIAHIESSPAPERNVMHLAAYDRRRSVGSLYHHDPHIPCKIHRSYIKYNIN